MDFDKVFLGYSETDDFARLAIREKFITSFSSEWANEEVNDFEDAFFEAHSSRVANKSSLLRMLLLFENIDSNRLVTYNLDKLIESGLVGEKSVIYKGTQKTPDESLTELKIMGSINYKEEHEENIYSLINGLVIDMDNSLDTSFFNSIHETEIRELADDLSNGSTKKAREIFLNSELPFILAENIIETKWFDNFLLTSGVMGKNQGFIEEVERLALRFAKANICRFILNPAIAIVRKNDITKYSNNMQINKCAELLDNLFIVDGKARCKTCEMRRSLECLDSFRCKHSLNRYVTLIDIFTSLEENLTVYSRYFKTTAFTPVNDAKIVDDVYYLFKLPMLKQLNSLPTPQSFEEMLRLRARPEIVSFRNVFKEWCQQLKHLGDENAIELITKDFNRASEYLKKQYGDSQKEQDAKHAIMQNILSIILEVPGMFIPFFSLLFSLPEPWIKRNRVIKNQESEWFLLTR